jgi:hypothetical protein
MDACRPCFRIQIGKRQRPWASLLLAGRFPQLNASAITVLPLRLCER